MWHTFYLSCNCISSLNTVFKFISLQNFLTRKYLSNKCLLSCLIYHLPEHFGNEKVSFLALVPLFFSASIIMLQNFRFPHFSIGESSVISWHGLVWQLCPLSGLKHCSFLFHFKSPFTLQPLPAPVYQPVLPSALPQNFYVSVFSLRACSTLYWCQNAVDFNSRLHLLVFSGKGLPKFRG